LQAVVWAEKIIYHIKVVPIRLDLPQPFLVIGSPVKMVFHTLDLRKKVAGDDIIIRIVFD
jgi:hypothetical protein